MRRVRLIDVLDEPHWQAGCARRVVLALHGRALALLRRIGECRPALELALDSLFGDEGGNQLHPAQARLRIGRRAVAAVATTHLAIDGLLQRGDLRRRAPGDPRTDPPPLKDDDPGPLPLQHQRCGEAGDAPTQHGDIGLHFAVERAVVRLRRGCEP